MDSNANKARDLDSVLSKVSNMKTQKTRYADIVVPIILAYLLPIIFMFIISFAFEAFAPDTFKSLERSKNGIIYVIAKRFLTGEYVALLQIPLFLSLVLGIFTRDFKIFIGVPLIIYALLPFAVYMNYADEAIIVWLLVCFFILPIAGGNYFVLRVLFVNFPKIKKIAYILTALFPIVCTVAIFLDEYYRYKIDGNIVFALVVLLRSIPVGLFIILIIAYVYSSYNWRTKNNYIMPEELHTDLIENILSMRDKVNKK